MNTFTRITSVSDINNLEGIKLKDGVEFHFSLFFKSKNNDREYLLGKGNLILYETAGLVSTGNIENITEKYKELGYDEFVRHLTIGVDSE